MRPQDIEIGKYYRLKNTGDEYTKYYGWVKVLEVYKRGDYRSPDKIKSLVKVQHTVFKDDTTGFIRYFRPMDLVNTSEE